MRLFLAASSFAALTLFASGLWADERPDHFEGKASETLEQALSNFSETNRQLADILAQDEISMADMARIHELSYTLENALQRIDKEYDRLAEQLEELHLASEGGETERTRDLATTFLENAERFPR